VNAQGQGWGEMGDLAGLETNDEKWLVGKNKLRRGVKWEGAGLIELTDWKRRAVFGIAGVWNSLNLEESQLPRKVWPVMRWKIRFQQKDAGGFLGGG